LRRSPAIAARLRRGAPRSKHVLFSRRIVRSEPALQSIAPRIRYENAQGSASLEACLDTMESTPSESSEEPVAPRTERGRDRRRVPTPRFSRHSFFGGRRKSVRRDSEREGSFVDLYSTRLFLIVMWVALMNVADSFFTLIHLQHGGSEANPIAGVLLLTGRTSFVFWKSALIAAALLVLCIHKNFCVARYGLWAAALCYTLLLGYHLSLFGV
jgi:hypothetical protein